MEDLRKAGRSLRWGAVPTAALVPAHADTTWSGCDTDRFKGTGKYKGKVELTIIQRAKGCMEYHTLPDGSSCGVLTSYKTVTTGRRKAKTVRKWGTVVSGSNPERVETGCNFLGDNTGLEKFQEKFTGRYKIDRWLIFKDAYSVPGLTVRISAANLDKESIVRMTKTGKWNFGG